MKNLSKTMLAVLATSLLGCALFSQQAQAIPIQGNINFAGGVQFDTNSLSGANGIQSNSWSNSAPESVGLNGGLTQK
jgi:hypothetical protein